jgi:hypothetical protein
VSAGKGHFKAASNKPVSEIGWDLFAAADNGNKDASGRAQGGENKMDTDNNPHGFTGEDDKKMLEWKSNNATKPWTMFAAEIGKTSDQCKERFKQIKPKDWKPNDAKGKSGGAGDQKQSKKDKKQNQTWNQGQSNKKNDEATGGDADVPWNTSAWPNDTADVGVAESGDNNKESTTKADDPWNTGAWLNDTADVGATEAGGNNKETTNKADEWTGVTAAWDTLGNTNGKSSFSKKGSVKGGLTIAANSGGGENTGDGDIWGNDGANDNSGGNALWENIGNDKGGVDAAAPAWDIPANSGDAAPGAWNMNNNSGLDANDTWNTAAPAKAASRAHSKAGNNKISHGAPQNNPHSNNAPTTTAVPAQIEIKPDGIFSTDDLRLIARILQQDASMVWNRLSWRFRDKTGRTLHPDIFERKITGHVEGKNSETGSRMGK